MRFHRELFDGYVREIGRVLKVGGLLHLHHAARWPEAEINERSFQYRDEQDIEAPCSSAGLRLTNHEPVHIGFIDDLAASIGWQGGAPNVGKPPSVYTRTHHCQATAA